MSKSHIVLYAHGFAVDKESRGLFKDIAASLPDIDHEFVDLNAVSDDRLTIRVRTIDEQVDILQRRLTQLLTQLPEDSFLDIVCHSLGCVVASLAAQPGIRRAILITPPRTIGLDHARYAYEGRHGVSLRLDADSTFARKDGVTAKVPKEYWAGLDAVAPVPLYESFARQTDMRIIIAAQDEQRMPGEEPISISGAHEYVVEGNHNFTHQYRKNLVMQIKSLLI